MQILIGGDPFKCTVVFRKRKTLCIQIRPPGEIRILAPFGKSEREIQEAVRTKRAWITKKILEMKELPYPAKEKQYVNGETFLYLGQTYVLQIIENEKYKRLPAEIDGPKLLVYTPQNNPEVVRSRIESWYREKALKIVSERIAYYQCLFKMAPTRVCVKKQKNRWGSCTSKHRLLFNFKCVMLPLWILDYIVVHEMCHMVHLNHSKEFWRLVEQILPDYGERKKWLKNNGGIVI